MGECTERWSNFPTCKNPGAASTTFARARALRSSNRGISGTTYRLAFEAYVLQRALQMKRSFCFEDIPNLSHNHFKKIILRLKKKGYVVARNPRTCPRFYRLTPKYRAYLLEIVDREYLSTPFGVNARAVDSSAFQRKEGIM